MSENVLVSEEDLNGLDDRKSLLLLPEERHVDGVSVVGQHLPLLLVNPEVLGQEGEEGRGHTDGVIAAAEAVQVEALERGISRKLDSM